MAQFARPDSTVSAGLWEPQGGPSTLWEAIDEISASDTDYIEALNGENTTCELGLSTVADPLSSVNHTIRFRMQATGSGGPERCEVQLWQGGTEIASTGNQTSRGSWGDKTYTLSAAEADAIGDYSDLRLKIISSNLSATEDMWVSWAEFEVPDAPTDTPMAAAQGNYTVTGQSALFIRSHIAIVDQGLYTLTGQAVITTKAIPPPLAGSISELAISEGPISGSPEDILEEITMVAAQGSYDLTGFAAITSRQVTISVAQGSYNLSGQNAITLWKHLILAAQGNYNLNGQAAILSQNIPIIAVQGSYNLSGFATDLLWKHLILAVQGSYNLTGFAAATSEGFRLVTTQGSYILTGQAADFLWNHLVLANQGAYNLSGQVIITTHDIPTIAAQGSYILDGQAALLSRQVTIIGAQGSYVLTGIAADLFWKRLVLAVQGGYILTGFDATTFVTSAEILTAIQGSYILTGQPADLLFSGAAGAIYKPVYRPRRRN